MAVADEFCAKRSSTLLRLLRRCQWILLAALALALGGATGVSAHNALSSSEPVDGAVLDIAPSTWSLTFTGDVPIDSASAEVVLADGTRAALPPPVHGSTTSVIVFSLPDGLSGDVTGRWRLVGTDGHVITGRVQFSVTAVPVETTTISDEVPLEDAPPTSEPAIEDAPVEETTFDVGTTPTFADPTPESVRWILQIISYLGLVTVGGLVFADVVLARGILRRPRVTLALQAGALALFVSSAVKALIHVADIEGVTVTSAFRHVASVFDTTAGSMLVARTLIGFVLLMVTLTLDQRPLDSRFVRGLGALIVLHIITVPFTGHARSMRWPALGVPADIVHLFGVTVWAGGLLALVAFVMPAAHSANAVTAYVRFSSYASWAVIALVVTGVIQSIRLYEQPLSALDSTHGVILAIKIALVAVMLGVGWWSRKLLAGDEMAGDDLRARLIRVTALEAGLGIVVIAVSAALVRATFNT